MVLPTQKGDTLKKSTKVKIGVAGTSLLLTMGTLEAFWTNTDGVSPTDGKVLYGINRDSGQLFRYGFDAQWPSNVGVITDADGNTMAGIDASASIPGHQNIYGFWTDPDEGLVHLVYVNAETAAGTPVGDDLGQGQVTGATAAQVAFVDDHDHDDHDDDDDGHDDDHDDDDEHDDDDHGHGSHGDDDDDHGHHDDDDDHGDHDDDDDDDHGDHDDDDDEDDDDDDDHHHHAHDEAALGWSLFAVQTLETEPDDDDDDHEDHGHGNDDDGVDDDNPGNSDGVNEHGQGHGAHDGDGDDDHGHDDGHDDHDGDDDDHDDHADHDEDDHDDHADDDEHGDDDDDEHESASVTGYRLIQVDHHSGDVTELMTLSRSYDGLATTDGLTFMGTSGSDLYLIDPVAQTETLVGASGLDEMFGLEFADSTLIGFENVGDRLVPVDVTTGSQLGSPVNIGASNLGTIVFMNASVDPASNSDSYD